MEQRGYSRQEALEVLNTFDLQGKKNHFVLRRGPSQSFGRSALASEQSYVARLKYPSEDIGLENIFEQLTVLFEVLLSELKKDYGENGMARIYIAHKPTGEHFIVRPTVIRDLTPEYIMEILMMQISSARRVPCDDHLHIYVAAVKNIQGSGYRTIRDIQRDKVLKRSLVTITENGLCLPRAIVVGHALLLQREATQTGDPELKKIAENNYGYVRRGKSRQQRERAKKLQRAVGLPENCSEGHISDIPLYEDHLQVSISVVSLRDSSQPIYMGKAEYSDRKIFLLHTQGLSPDSGHFDVITTMTGLFGRRYFCDTCQKLYNSRGQHSCKHTCNVCGSEACREVSSVICGICNLSCRSLACLKRHRDGYVGKTGKQVEGLCSKKWKCPECKILLDCAPDSVRVKYHVCGESQCSVCKQIFVDTHYCHMKIPVAKKSSGRFVFFDFECMQETGVHIPNLVVAQTSCTTCQDFRLCELSECPQCGFRCEKCDKKERGEYVQQPCQTNSVCCQRRVVWSGLNCQDEFCRWLLSENNRDAKVFAHNAKGYDSYFILAYLRKQDLKPDQIIMSGAKVMYLKMGGVLNVELLDSLNFLPMALSSLPKSFGLSELKKGFFPYLFNTQHNQNVVLTELPDQKFYNPDDMYPEKREEFLQWYAANKHKGFDLQKEMLDYCISDVTILQEACMKFRELVLTETGRPVLHQGEWIPREGIDPFSYVTIASLCLGILRRKFLPEKRKILFKVNAQSNCMHSHASCQCLWNEGRKLSEDHPLEVWRNDSCEWETVDDELVEENLFVSSPIGLIPSDEYGVRGNHSQEALEWLDFIQYQFRQKDPQVVVHHARNGGEQCVLYKTKKGLVRYRLDGYCKTLDKRYALEFHGCVWHGCTKCYRVGRTRKIVHGRSMHELFAQTKLKERRLKELGFCVITMWECEFVKLKQSEEFQTFSQISCKPTSPLRLRDAYFGGRTNAIVLHKVMKEGEEGCYVDFTSLYSDTMKYQRYPTGHPEKIYKPTVELVQHPCSKGRDCISPNTCLGFHKQLPYFGMIKVTVSPPSNLIYPVLPVRIRGKLMFPLCYSCAEQNNTINLCSCDETDRQFTQTYSTPELNAALQCGYQIIEIHEVLHWKESAQYNEATKEGGLFGNYINTFMKMKQEASGYPSHVQSPLQKVKYIEEYLQHEGIQLDPSRIEKNPGLRSLAKLCLNSVYGKFGQRADLRRTTFISSDSELYSLILDHSKTIVDFSVISESVMQITWVPADDFVPLSHNSSVVLALFCTTYARLKLLKLMNQLSGRVLYHDTDSVIFTNHPPNQFTPKLGPYLGELTNELTCSSVQCNNSDCSGKHVITKFVSCGPKNYAYRLNSGQVICKIRGFSLSHSNSQVLNFASMKKSLYAWMKNSDSTVVTVKTEICRNKQDVTLVNKQVVKKYGVIFDKRVVQADFSSLPFGFRK